MGQSLKSVIIAIFLLSLFLFNPTASLAFQSPQEQLNRAKVISVIDHPEQPEIQTVEIQLLTGPQVDQILTLEHGQDISITEHQKVKVGEQVVVNTIIINGQQQSWIVDHYRFPGVVIAVFCFFILVIIIAGRKGLGSIIGMFLSLGIIIWFIVPQILAGHNPLVISLIGSLVILILTLYLAHGYNLKTTLSLVSTLVALLITGVLAIISVTVLKLTGSGSEEAVNLRLGATEIINLRGLLLGGIIIGTLGVLDDITTGQVAIVFELKAANSKLKFKELIKRAKSVGTEHIASLVNTLIMAYAGAAMPIFIYLVLNPTQSPLWLIVNNELIAEEIIRTLAGSVGLICAVPISTIIASWYISRYPHSITQTTDNSGHHH